MGEQVVPILRVDIGRAEEIDTATRNAIEKRIYRVVVWVNPGEEFATPLAKGSLDPKWNWSFDIIIGREFDPLLLLNKFLHVEVIRVGSNSESGSSQNITVVGRARIPLPYLGQKRCDRYGLVVPCGYGVRGEGHINIQVEMGYHVCD